MVCIIQDLKEKINTIQFSRRLRGFLIWRKTWGYLSSTRPLFRVDDLIPLLENIETLQRLKELRREALRTYSLETFVQILENGGNIEP